jgi:hypothetical protein
VKFTREWRWGFEEAADWPEQNDEPQNGEVAEESEDSEESELSFMRA